MALQFQTIPVPLTHGLDTRTDPKALPIGGLTTLENGVFTAPGRIQKRNGYSTLPRDIEASASSLTSAVGLATFGDELLLASGTKLYSYGESTGHWVDRGSYVPCAVSSIPVTHSAGTQSNMDATTNGGVRVVAWEESGGVKCSVQDVERGTFFVVDHVLSAAASSPRVVASGKDILVFYVNANNLFFKKLTITQPTSIGTETNPLATLVSNAPTYDVMQLGSRLFVAWNDNSSVGKIGYFDSAYTVVSATSLVRPATNFVSLFADTVTATVYALYSDTAFRTSLKSFTYTLTPVSSTLTVEANQSKRGTGFVSGSVATVFYEVIPSAGGHYIRKNTYDASTATLGTAVDFRRSVGLAAKAFVVNGSGYLPTSYYSALQATYFVLDSDGAVVAKCHPHSGGPLRTAPTLADSSQPSSGVVEFATGVQTRLTVSSGNLFAYVGVAISRIDFTQTAVSSAVVGNNCLLGGGIVRAYDGVTLCESGFHLFPELDASSFSQVTAVTFNVTQQGDGTHAEVTDITFAATGRIAPAQYFTINSTSTAYYVWFTIDGVGADPAPGGTGIKVAINNYDSGSAIATAVAAAINAGTASQITAAAVGNVVTTTNASNGAVTDAANAAAPNGLGTGSVSGTVQYTVLYERTDAFGQIVRSVPSVPVSVTVSGPGGVTLIVPSLRITSASNVRIAVYRTQDAQTTYYRVSSLSAPPANSVTQDFYYFTDTLSDSAAAGNELLYTQPGDPNSVLENDAPQPATQIVNWKTRAVTFGGESRNAVYYSMQTSPFDPVNFNDALYIQCDSRGGDITALGVLDDKLIVFKADAIFAVAGDGPSNNGGGAPYGSPELIASDVGCKSISSVVQTAGGLMFQSAKGIYLLDRSLACSYVGAPVEAYNSSTVVAATMVPHTNQVRFLTDSSTALVFHYLTGDWSTFTNHAGTGAAVSGSLYHFVRANGTVCRESIGSYLDDGGASPIRLRLVTGWLSFAGFQGFQRVRSIVLDGTFKGPHKLVWQVAVDDEPAFTQYQIIDAVSAVGTGSYGSDPLYGASTGFGEPWNPYQFQLSVVKQKNQRIMVSIEDAQSSDYNEGYNINALTFEVGAKPGVARVPAARSF